MLLEVFKNSIVSGLQRTAVQTCSLWAEKYRVMGRPFPGKWTFDHHPWTREMHDVESDFVVGQKAAQMGFTETALNKVFHAIDLSGQSVLYVLPANTPDANDFSTSRFDAALELSDHLKNLFSDVKNIGHKRAGSANLYIRGSRSRSQLKSVPVGLVILDEVDEMVQENIPLVFERMSGQPEKQCFAISTPTIDNVGINHYFRNSTQNVFFFRCPSCGRFTNLTFPECLVIAGDDFTSPEVEKSYMICKECKSTLPHEQKQEFLSSGKWVPTHTDRNIQGYHVNQLYSTTVRPAELAKSYLKAQFNPADEQEFFNSKLGITHAVKGAKITDEIIDSCIKEHKIVKESTSKIVTLGVDVGKWLHFEVDEWTIDLRGGTTDISLLADCKVIDIGKVLNFEELDLIMRNHRVGFCVIDANPERRKAFEFAQRHWGRVLMCIYAIGINSKSLHIHSEEEHMVSVDRTSWLDLSLGRLMRKAIRLPMDTPLEYKNHIKAPVRVYQKDSYGNPVGRYLTSNNDEDHFAHARNYAEIALPLVASLLNNQPITERIV